jgi:nucleoside-diphosphate-sugar epimerase
MHGLRFLALRFFSVWGPGQRPDLALEAFRRRIEAGQPVIINGDGSQVGGFHPRLATSCHLAATELDPKP